MATRMSYEDRSGPPLVPPGTESFITREEFRQYSGGLRGAISQILQWPGVGGAARLVGVAILVHQGPKVAVPLALDELAGRLGDDPLTTPELIGRMLQRLEEGGFLRKNPDTGLYLFRHPEHLPAHRREPPGVRYSAYTTDGRPLRGRGVFYRHPKPIKDDLEPEP